MMAYLQIKCPVAAGNTEFYELNGVISRIYWEAHTILPVREKQVWEKAQASAYWWK